MPVPLAAPGWLLLLNTLCRISVSPTALSLARNNPTTFAVHDVVHERGVRGSDTQEDPGPELVHVRLVLHLKPSGESSAVYPERGSCSVCSTWTRSIARDARGRQYPPGPLSSSRTSPRRSRGVVHVAHGHNGSWFEPGPHFEASVENHLIVDRTSRNGSLRCRREVAGSLSDYLEWRAPRRHRCSSPPHPRVLVKWCSKVYQPVVEMAIGARPGSWRRRCRAGCCCSR